MSIFSAFRAISNNLTSTRLNNQQHAGVVVDNNDPDQLQRIKIRCKGVHDNVPDDHLPWVAPRTLSNYQTTQNQGGLGPIPTKGSMVYVEYSHPEDPHSLFYTGGVQQGGSKRNTQLTKDFQKKATGSYENSQDDGGQSDTSGDQNSQSDQQGQGQGQSQDPDLSKDYPWVWGSVDPTGSRMVWNHKEEKSYFEYTHVSGLVFGIDGKGHVSLSTADKAVGKQTERYSAGMTLNIKGDLNITSSGKVNIGGKEITMKSGGDMRLHATSMFRADAQKAFVHAEFLKGPPVIYTDDIQPGGKKGEPEGPGDVQDPQARSRPTEKVES